MTRHESFCIILLFCTKKEIKMKIGLIGAVAVAAVVVAGCGKKVSPATAGEQGKDASAAKAEAPSLAQPPAPATAEEIAKVAPVDPKKVAVEVNGKKLTALSAPLIVSEVSALPGMTTYTLYADILDAKTKYYKTVVFTVKVPVVQKPVPKVSAAFAK